MDFKILNQFRYVSPNLKGVPGNYLNRVYWKIKMEIDFNFKMIDYLEFLRE